jgi:hypothetical protein
VILNSAGRSARPVGGELLAADCTGKNLEAGDRNARSDVLVRLADATLVLLDDMTRRDERNHRDTD